MKLKDLLPILTSFPAVYTEEAKLLKDAKSFLSLVDNCLIIRQEATTRAGIPDLIVCYKGRFIGIELKDDTGIPSPQQLKWGQQIEAAGGTFGICRNIEEIYAMLVFCKLCE